MTSILGNYYKLWLGNPHVEGPSPKMADGDHLKIGGYIVQKCLNAIC